MSEEAAIEIISSPAAPADGITTSAPPIETPEPPKVLTQEDVDKAVTARLAREQAKHSRELQREREERIRMEERLAAAAPKTEVKAEGAPKLDDFQDFGQYVAAVARYEAKQAAGEVTKTSREEAGKAQEQMRQQQAVQGYFAKVKEFTKERPDFQEVVSASPSALTPTMKAFILQADQGPRLAIHLAEHPDEAEQIASLTPEMAARKLTLIEAGFQANVTKTPPPITPTGARSTAAVKSIADVTSQAEWEKRRREFRAKR